MNQESQSHSSSADAQRTAEGFPSFISWLSHLKTRYKLAIGAGALAVGGVMQYMENQTLRTFGEGRVIAVEDGAFTLENGNGDCARVVVRGEAIPAIGDMRLVDPKSQHARLVMNPTKRRPSAPERIFNLFQTSKEQPASKE